MKYTERKERDGQFVEIEIELRERRGALELSICGIAGDVVPEDTAYQMSEDSITEYFEEDWNAIKELNKRFGTDFRTPGEAAQFVRQTDGDFAFLDYHDSVGDQVYLTHSCGQIREELTEWFPEYTHLLRYHLNAMKPICIHVGEHLPANTREHTCFVCGAEWGHAWHLWPLPSDVVKEVQALSGK